MNRRIHFLGFLLGAVIAAFVCVLAAAADGLAYTIEFRDVNSLTVVVDLESNEVDTSADELKQYLEDILYVNLRGKLPASVKVYRISQPEGLLTPTRVWLLVLLQKPSFGGYYGDVILQLDRTAFLTPAQADDEPLFATVYQNRYILTSGDVSNLKGQLREAAEDAILSLVTDFYAARPDLQ